MTIGNVRWLPKTGDTVSARRVDRGGSALGNPYVLGRERDREAVCDAYELLLGVTLMEADALRARDWDAARIGRACGFEGEVRSWDWDGARSAMADLRDVARGGPLRLDCHCAPRRCHAESVRARLVCRAWSRAREM